MKLRYDENAQDRNFEPGDKVLALLPIPDNHCKLDIMVLILLTKS